MVKYNQTDLNKTFQALASPTRRDILGILATGTPTVTELAGPFKMSLPAISKHLKILEVAGLIERRKKGRMYYFDIITKPIEDAEQWIVASQIFWKTRLTSLEKYLANNKERNNKRKE